MSKGTKSNQNTLIDLIGNGLQIFEISTLRLDSGQENLKSQIPTGQENHFSFSPHSNSEPGIQSPAQLLLLHRRANPSSHVRLAILSGW